MKALQSPNFLEACFRNEERIKRVMAKHEEEEKKKAKKKSIDKEEFDKKMSEILESTDDARRTPRTVAVLVRKIRIILATHCGDIPI
jgi:RPA family protein